MYLMGILSSSSAGVIKSNTRYIIILFMKLVVISLCVEFSGKFLALLEQGNPNIIWSLYQPSWYEIEELKDLRKHRQKFITSRAIHQVTKFL